MIFSDRLGLTQPKSALQIDDIDQDLRNGLTGNTKATLGDALKKLEENKPLHPAFKQAIDKLYGYTSDEGGIRHSLVDLDKVDEADAKFMIVTCSAFVNFCVQRT